MTWEPDASDETQEGPLLPEGGAAEWNRYLDRWEQEVYAPIFSGRGIGRETALTCWFVNRLRNALNDDDAGDEPWKGDR